MTEIKGHWFSVDYCDYCHEQLSDYEVMYSNGTCPYCGTKGPSAATVTDHYSKAHRNIYKRVYILGFIPWKEFVRQETKE